METIKKSTKAGTGCGGCIPLVTNIFKAEMKKAGHTLSSNLCPHFPRSRRDVFDIVRVKKLKSFNEVLATAGIGQGIGCEICKPAVASILASLWNEPVMNLSLNQLQDTNDKFLGNIQRNGKSEGSYSGFRREFNGHQEHSLLFPVWPAVRLHLTS
jgi:nitrite reductase (NAD(P)H)